jgi:hypothetical protein
LKAITVKTYWTLVRRDTRPTGVGHIEPGFVIAHEVPLERGPEMDQSFR